MSSRAPSATPLKTGKVDTGTLALAAEVVEPHRHELAAEERHELAIREVVGLDHHDLVARHDGGTHGEEERP